MKKITSVLLLLVSPGFSLEGNTQTIDVFQAIEIALRNNPEIQAKDMDIQSARSLNRTVFEWPKTEVSFQYGNNEGFEYNDGLQVSQNIPFPTLFGARKNLFAEQVKGSELAKVLTENELKKQVRSRYYQLEYFEHNGSVLESLDSLYADFVTVTELRYKTGDIGKLDVSTAVTKRGEIKLLLQQNEVYRKQSYDALKNLMQSKEDFSIQKAGEYMPLFLTDFIDSSLILQHPRIQLLYQEARVAEGNKKVERANGLPDFTVGYNNISLIGWHNKNGIEQFYNRGQRFSFIDVGIAVPLTFGATKAKMQALEYQKQSHEMNAEWQQKLLNTELRSALNQYEQNIVQFKYFREQALPNADEIIQGAQLGYRTGDISYVEYLFALQTATDIRLNYLKSIQQVNESVVLIYYLINK